MIKNLKSSLILTVILILMFGVMYPLIIYAIGLASPSGSIGSPNISGADPRLLDTMPHQPAAQIKDLQTLITLQKFRLG